jgi:hypothetical protein
MKTIRRIALAVLLALLFAAGVKAQDPPACKVKVRILAFKWEDSREFRHDVMSPDQTEWWIKEGQKKFPNVCIVTTSGEADYLIAWTATSETATHSYTVPKTETTVHSGTVNATSTTTGPLGSTDTYGTYRGTSTRTTYEKKEYEWTNSYVVAHVHKTVDVEVDGQKRKRIEKPPVFTAQHRGQWRWSLPDKDALKKAMEFIQKQLK